MNVAILEIFYANISPKFGGIIRTISEPAAFARLLRQDASEGTPSDAKAPDFLGRRSDKPSAGRAASATAIRFDEAGLIRSTPPPRPAKSPSPYLPSNNRDQSRTHPPSQARQPTAKSQHSLEPVLKPLPVRIHRPAQMLTGAHKISEHGVKPGSPQSALCHAGPAESPWPRPATIRAGTAAAKPVAAAGDTISVMSSRFVPGRMSAIQIAIAEIGRGLRITIENANLTPDSKSQLTQRINSLLQQNGIWTSTLILRDHADHSGRRPIRGGKLWKV